MPFFPNKRKIYMNQDIIYSQLNTAPSRFSDIFLKEVTRLYSLICAFAASLFPFLTRAVKGNTTQWKETRRKGNRKLTSVQSSVQCMEPYRFCDIHYKLNTYCNSLQIKHLLQFSLTPPPPGGTPYYQINRSGWDIKFEK